ncbi:ABC transporter ATP-binding protein [Paenibacillus sp. MMS20-IR301]|uniref:ABC transporter ATP-binding protein n=1 Tax=Paenibacillus sp. MMS20-IR301 TaxID=2895946 RepID=UPI0028F0FB42|nr:ABC transporter ATP-binding protein [Paenibacillus sp. MMS20-IR301]WNS40689.1 ABC transporter ATP-binding protein [Paenibacillus sp. MMS20-IR301]
MSETALELKALEKSYGRFKAVDRLSFSVKRGEIFSLLGPNGAGKTTAINLIAGILEPDHGSIEMNGSPVRGSRSWSSRIGVCHQEKQLWPLLTCEEQLYFAGDMYRMDRKRLKQRAALLLEQVGLAEKRKVLAKNLSGGMQRRLHMILSVIHHPELIILDEPEAGLDPQSRVLVREFIKTLSETGTVLLTTHNMDEAERLSSRVAVMDKGQVLVCGTPAALQQMIAPEETLDIYYPEQIQQTALLNSPGYAVQFTDRSISITGSHLAGAVPRILDQLNSLYGNPLTFTLRQSTLEDVFIKLTGRSLRE